MVRLDSKKVAVITCNQFEYSYFIAVESLSKLLYKTRISGTHYELLNILGDYNSMLLNSRHKIYGDIITLLIKHNFDYFTFDVVPSIRFVPKSTNVG